MFILSGIILLIIFYSYFIEPNYLKKDTLRLDFSCANGSVKFVQISDLHFTSDTSDWKISQIAETAKSIGPSAVFITGDFISDKSGVPKALQFAKELSKDLPVYAVFGNWDYYSLDYDVTGFKDDLERSGVDVLLNENEKITVESNIFYVLGVKDPYTSGENESDLKKSFHDIDFNNGACKILLAHSPNVIKYARDKKIDLILVGHTHGGQIYIPFVIEHFIPSRREGGKGYISGLYKINGTSMYVNRGIGASIIPFRFLVPPEITIIDLH